MTAEAAPKSEDTPQGFAYAISAYTLWGFLPLYLSLLSHIPPLEVVAHRVLWSLPLAALVLIATRRIGDLKAALTSPRALAMGAITASLVSINWLIYVWAVANGQAVDAALGYYINPLFSVFLGAVLLGERLNRLQLVAVGLAALAVAVLTVESGSVPLVSIGLTISWGFYALAKKQLPIGPNQGFFLEVLILAIPALCYLIWVGPAGAFGGPDTLVLIGCGAVTAIPLMFYANGAKGLRLTTIAILQYIAPTMIFLCAILVLGESLDRARAIAFPLIWAALVVYSYTLLRARR